MRPRRSQIIAGVLVLAAVTGVCWIVSQVWQPRRALAARISAGLDDAQGEAVADRLRQLAAFGEDGLPHLAAALKHERRDIAEEARAVLSEEIDRWQLLPSREAAQRVVRLAEELARGIESCSPVTRRLAGDLATRLLLWPVEPGAIDQTRLIAHCERVLLSVRGDDRPSVVLAEQSTAYDSPVEGEPFSPLATNDEVPGGNLPIEATGVPALPPEARDARPAPLPIEDEEGSLQPVREEGAEPRRLDSDATSASIESAAATDTLDHIYRLVSADDAEREEAAELLRAAGFDEAQLEVARRFADPSAAVRRRLVAQLAGQGRINARPWLLQMLNDEDASVRLAAARVLATNGDPSVARALRERALVEADEEVRSVLNRSVR